MIRQIPASAFTTLFLLAVYLLSGFRTVNGLSLLIFLSLLWLAWAIYLHLRCEVQIARDDHEAARNDLTSYRIEETNR